MKNFCSILLVGLILFLSGSVSFASVDHRQQYSTTIEQGVSCSHDVVYHLMKYDAVLADTFDIGTATVQTSYTGVAVKSKSMYSLIALTGFKHRFY